MLVTAAFIGPGTVLSASKAGAIYGFSLLWAVAFSVIAAIVLQEMSARLGIVTGSGLAQAIKGSFQTTWLKVFVLGLILMGILAGNAAFQTGNILGAAAGAAVLTDAMVAHPSENHSKSSTEVDNSRPTIPAVQETARESLTVWIFIMGGIAWLLILSGKFELLQNVLTVMVVLMSVLFMVAAGLSQPGWSAIAGGLVPQIPAGSGWFIVALIGTTVVPYNLFLHASAAAQRWPAESVCKTINKERAVKDSRRDTTVAVSIGGLVTAAILVTAAMAFHVDRPAATAPNWVGVADVARQLEPALGAWAKWLFGAGLCAAGLTSAITAPIAAAYTAAGCFGWSAKLSDWRLKVVASLVLLTGVGCAIGFGGSPQETILMAQAANGLLLPLIAVFLLIVMNRVNLMFRFRNSAVQNVWGFAVVVLVTLIAARQLGVVFQDIQKRWHRPVVSKITDNYP